MNDLPSMSALYNYLVVMYVSVHKAVYRILRKPVEAPWWSGGPPGSGSPPPSPHTHHTDLWNAWAESVVVGWSEGGDGANSRTAAGLWQRDLGMCSAAGGSEERSAALTRWRRGLMRGPDKKRRWKTGARGGGVEREG